MRRFGIPLVLGLALLTSCTSEVGGFVAPDGSTVAVTSSSEQSAPATLEASSDSVQPVPDTPTSVTSTSAVPEPPTEPILTPVSIPAELQGPGPRLTEPTILAGTANLPVMLVGMWSGATSAELMTWTSPTGAGWEQKPVPTGVPGNVVSVSAGASEQLAIIAGWTWDAGRLIPFALTSADRITWNPVALPATTGQITVGPVAVSGGIAYLLLTEFGDRKQGTFGSSAETTEPDVDTLYVINGGTATPRPLPPIDTETDRWITTMAAHDDEILLTGSIGPTDTATPLVAVKSVDQGATWTEPATIAGDGNALSGLVWTGSAYVGTGSRRANPQDVQKFGAWVSADGISWSSDPVQTPQNGSFTDPEDSTWFGEPALAGGTIYAVATSNTSLFKFLYYRDSEGKWVPAQEFAQQVRPGQSADLAFPSANSSDPVVMIQHPNGVQIIPLAQPEASATFGFLDPLPELGTVSSSSGGSKTTTESAEFVASTTGYDLTENGGWSIKPSNVPYLWSHETGLTASQFDPPELATKDTYSRGTDPETGAEVVLGRGWNADHTEYVLSGFYRSSADAPWQPTVGFNTRRESPGGLGEFANGVFFANGRWIAYGGLNATMEYAIIWASDDGIHWSRGVEQRDPQSRSWLSGYCLLPDGTPMVVGGESENLATNHPVAWTLADDAWKRSTLPAELGAGVFNSCTTTDDVTTVSATLDVTVFFTTTDGQEFTEKPVTLGNGQLFSSTEVAGGFIGLGFQRTDEFVGFALWLSRNGSEGRWVPLPLTVPYGTGNFRIVGDNALVQIDSDIGIQMWEVSGLAESFG